MGWLDYILIVAVVGLIVFAVWLYRFHKKNGSSCHGCDGNCSACREKNNKK